ncbi:hypothetical protein [Butyrivibrio sp. WCD3002]|uniref:hypothetical protein n=1 Tax=Butyrivibrio sp. WCD3002 TaxID=1280676 RepID=UPI00040A9CA6|nr:hypothetical protein [Butyrivibrio sp. WCD3002]
MSERIKRAMDNPVRKFVLVVGGAITIFNIFFLLFSLTIGSGTGVFVMLLFTAPFAYAIYYVLYSKEKLDYDQYRLIKDRMVFFELRNQLDSYYNEIGENDRKRYDELAIMFNKSLNEYATNVLERQQEKL